MAARHAENPSADNVISFPERDSIRLSPSVPDAISSGTKTSAEIVNLSSSLTAPLSPILPTPSAEQDQTVPCPRETPPARDEQHSLEEIAMLVPSLTDAELKSRFPKAWNEHQTIAKKCRRKSTRDTLHPGFRKFRDFLVAMGSAPSPKHSIDRIDPTNPVYGPDECRWATSKTQARNRSTNVHLTWAGERHTLAEWTELSGINPETLKKRHQRGWSVERIFADAPARKHRTPAKAPEATEAIARASPSIQIATVAAQPALDVDGWPAALKSSRDFETGWQHARAQAIKTGGDLLSKSFFGAWVIGSQLRAAQRTLTSAGLSELVIGRADLSPDRLAYLTKLAAENGIDVAHYDHLLSLNGAFYEAVAPRSRSLLDNGIRTLPQINPLDVWKVYKERG